MKDNQHNSQTAYQHNSHSSVSNTPVKEHGWSDAINRMIEQRYAFLDLQYEDDGYLFRGMSCGLYEALLDNKFWHYPGDDRGCHFEKELNVLLVSQDFSDAFTVSSLWEQSSDACILIFKSKIFNTELNNKNAAMMATAEPGVVFKYPFLCDPLTLQNISYLIVSAKLLDKIFNQKEVKDLNYSIINRLSKIINELQIRDKLIIFDSVEQISGRSSIERMLQKKMSEKSVSGAKTVKSELKPTLKK